MAEKYPPVRFKADVKDLLQERATTLAKERGIDEMSLPQYIAEASQYFEDNRQKAGNGNEG
jgi:hypothetical protein